MRIAAAVKLTRELKTTIKGLAKGEKDFSALGATGANSLVGSRGCIQ